MSSARPRPPARLLLAIALAGGCGGHVDPAPYLEAAAAYDVRILRDDYGIPHVLGGRDADVAYGLAFAHCEDDFETIQVSVMSARGRLAAHRGRDAAPVDYVHALLRVGPLVEARYESDLSAEARAVAEAYADGVNHYAVLHPEERWSGLLPVTGRDVVAGFVLKTPFFYGFDDVLRRVMDGELTGDAAEVARAAPRVGRGVGSNAVAVAPSRSADGATRLLVNSHQPLEGPVAWYEVRLRSEEGWDVAGGVFPGSPVMLHGHNRDLGWANTVNRPDLVDVYALELHPEDPYRYRLDGVWRQLEREEVGITVRLAGPLRWTFRREVLRSVHGPVVRTDGVAFALRYVGMEEVRQLEQLLRQNKARDFDTWREALAMQAMPSTNYVYADREGRIAYFYNARFPRRPEGPDWSGVVPGDRSDLVWDDFLPLSAVPQVVDPPSGFVASANHTPFRVTTGDANPDPADFPERLGIETGMTNRAWRALELYGGDASITGQEFQAYKYDKAYSPRSSQAAWRDRLVAMDPGDDALLRRAQEVLRGWDLRVDRESRGAALAVGAIGPLVRAEQRGHPLPDPRATLREAAATLEAHFGRLDPEWGRVNRLRRGEADVAVAGGPDALRAIYGEPAPDGTLTARIGDGLVMFVRWGPDGALRSESIHHFGAAMGHPGSPHYADQVPLYAAERTKRVPFDEAALRERTRRAYRPGE